MLGKIPENEKSLLTNEKCPISGNPKNEEGHCKTCQLDNCSCTSIEFAEMLEEYCG